jgi:transmembrane protein TMEM260 (protein O-mannosyltransferase)
VVSVAVTETPAAEAPAVRTSRWARLLAIAAPIVVGVLATALGVWRLMPGVGFWDTAEFQTVPPILGTAHPTGYPTYVLLGWVASLALSAFGDAAYRMNLLSAILVGVAAAITVDLVRVLTRSTILGVVAGLGLAATPIVWAIGTHADPHALHVVFVAAILWLLVRWERARTTDPTRADRWLVAAAIATGLSAGNHSLTLLLAIPIALYVLAVEPRIVLRWRFVLLCAAAAIVPAVLVYLELPLRGGLIPGLRAPLVYGTPNTWDGFKYVVLGEQFRGGISDPFGELPRKVSELADLAVRELGPLAFLVAIGFLVAAIRHPPYALLTGSALLITCFFNAAYVNADIERYYLGPALIAWTWLAILARAGVDLVAGGFGEESSAASPGAEAAAAPAAALGAAAPPASAGTGTAPADGGSPNPEGRRVLQPVRMAALLVVGILLLIPTVAGFGERAEGVDRTGDRAAAEWTDAVLDEVEDDAMIVSWWSYSTPLWYAQLIEGRRPDIFVADDRTRLDLNLGDLQTVIDGNLGVRPVYVIRIDQNEMAMLQDRYNLTPLTPGAGNVFKVTPRQSAVAPPAPPAPAEPGR